MYIFLKEVSQKSMEKQEKEKKRTVVKWAKHNERQDMKGLREEEKRLEGCPQR